MPRARKGNKIHHLRQEWAGDPLQRTMTDYAITALLFRYWTVMAVWLALIATHLGSLASVPNAAPAAAAVGAGVGWHLLTRRRNSIREKTPPYASQQ